MNETQLLKLLFIRYCFLFLTYTCFNLCNYTLYWLSIKHQLQIRCHVLWPFFCVSAYSLCSGSIMHVNQLLLLHASLYSHHWTVAYLSCDRQKYCCSLFVFCSEDHLTHSKPHTFFQLQKSFSSGALVRISRGNKVTAFCGNHSTFF